MRARFTLMYTLYVARETGAEGRHNLGSVICMSIVARLRKGIVDVQEVDASQRTAFLVGTPTLVAKSRQEGVRSGVEAFERLLDLLQSPPHAGDTQTTYAAPNAATKEHAGDTEDDESPVFGEGDMDKLIKRRSDDNRD